jgi:Fic family protein
MSLKDTFWGMKPNKKLSIQLAKRQLSELVYDAVNLEGVNMTLPEVQTLLEGITVGGHNLSDQEMAVNQSKAWKKVFELIESDSWEFSKKTALAIHNIAGYNEALSWGNFRDGNVTIAGTEYLPPDHSKLSVLFSKMISDSKNYEDVYEKAFFVFLNMARNQFFYDVNKRMGRFMMNGLLLNAGYPTINIQAKRKLEFNEKMLLFYDSGEMQPMFDFLRSSLDQRVIKIIKDKN